jgi:transcription initiation factor TFIID subunit 5
MYLELIYNNHSEEAKQLMEKFSENLEDYYQSNLNKLSNVTKREQMAGNELTDTFK